MLVYPPETGVSVWNGRDLLRIASVLQNIKLDDGKVIETSGLGGGVRVDDPIDPEGRPDRHHRVADRGARSSSLFTMRPAAAALMALGTLMFGVLLMMGGAGWAKVHVTFLNFIALPITFGIGAEYALNVVSRFREERDISRAVVSTGAAVALCSWTTIVGYGSLLAAQNQALQGFGLMAIIGEVACLSAAIIALPAFLLWRRVRPLDETRAPGPRTASASTCPRRATSRRPPACRAGSVVMVVEAAEVAVEHPHAEQVQARAERHRVRPAVAG